MTNQVLVRFRALNAFAKTKVAVSIGLAILVFAGSTWSIYQIVKLQFAVHAAERVLSKSPVHKEEKKEALHLSYEIKNLSLPLKEKSSRQMAEANMTLILDLPSEEAVKMMQLNHAKLLSIALESGEPFSIDDFRTSKGLKLFKKRFLEGISEAFPDVHPNAVLIKEFLIH